MLLTIFTFAHVIISLAGILAGFVVLGAVAAIKFRNEAVRPSSAALNLVEETHKG